MQMKTRTLELPPEYDSYFVRHDVMDKQPMHLDSEGVLPSHIMHHEYIVRDPAQALPLYLVHFEYDPEDHEQLALPICDNCGIKAAIVYCEADAAGLCENCDLRIHAVNTIAQKHIRVPINERPGSKLGRCPEHPDMEADEYCTECELPICSHCKTMGSHGSEAFARHKRIPILDAYRSTLRAGRDVHESTSLPSRLQAETKLMELDSRLTKIQRSSTTLEDSAYEAIQQEVYNGRSLAEEQASYILSDQYQLKLQLDLLQWSESFFQEYVTALPPPDFLRSYTQHCQMRNEITRNVSVQAPRPPTTVRIDGRLRVVAAPKGAGSATAALTNGSPRGSPRGY